MRSVILSLWMPVALFALWWFASAFSWVNPYLLPRPEAVFAAFIELCENGLLWVHVQSSLGRAFGGYIIAALIALPMGYFFAKYETLHTQSRLILESLRMIPPLSLIPLLILWLGIGETAKLTIVLLASFFPIYLNAYSGFKQLDYRYGELAETLNLSTCEKIQHIEFPGALPAVFTWLRLGFVYSWRALVSAELIAAPSGLGYLISDASEMARTDQVFVGIFMIAILGILGDFLFQKALFKVAPWSKK